MDPNPMQAWTRVGTVIALAAIAAGTLLWPERTRRPTEPEVRTARVERQPFETWAWFDGRIEARRVVGIASRFNGPATIVELIPEGTYVRPGDVLVRFDASQVHTALSKAERELAAAESEWMLLDQVTLPLELMDLESEIARAAEALEQERQTLADTRELHREGLTSEEEIRLAERRMESASRRLEMLRDRTARIRDQAHPARRAEARARVEAAHRECDWLRNQLAACTITSPVAGEVVYVPVPIGTEVRTVRVGDTVHMNQELMWIPDPSDWIVRFDVPEKELSQIRTGSCVRIRPLAWPSLEWTGRVESISSVSRARSGSWAGRVFPAVAQLTAPSELLRSGLSAEVAVQTFSKPDALVVPRAAVRWRAGEPYCLVRRGHPSVPVPIRITAADEAKVAIESGLDEGDVVEW